MAASSEPYVCNLSNDLVKKAEKELNEKPKYRAKDIEHMRDMINAHPGLKCPTDDRFILQFLRSRKFDYDRAYNMLLSYYQVRAEYSHHFQDIKPSSITDTINDGISIVLPKLDKQGRKILYYRPGLWNIEKYDVFNLLKVNVMNLEKIIMDEASQISGIVFLCNFEGVGLSHAKRIDREYSKIMTSMFQDAFPLRLKCMHFTNEPAVFSVVFALFKPFLKEKTLKRMNLHGSKYKNVQKDMGLECLPQELGGKLPPTEQLVQDWARELFESEAVFEEMLQYKLEIDRKIIKKQNDEMVESLVGTYKKLDVM